MNKYQVGEIVYCRVSLSSNEYFTGIIDIVNNTIYTNDSYLYGIKDVNSGHYGAYTSSSLLKYHDYNKENIESLLEDMAIDD